MNMKLFITKRQARELRELAAELRKYGEGRKASYARAFIRLFKREPKEYKGVVIFDA